MRNEKKMLKQRRKEQKRQSSRGKAFFNFLSVVVIALVIVYVVNKYETISASNKEPDITNAFVSSKLETVSELTSAELTYNGLIRYTDGKVPFITKKAFSMVYRACVEAGTDLSKVQVNVTDTKLEIILPEVEVFDITVDSDSIDFYDKEAALFNWTDREDVVEAIKNAQDDVEKNADINGLKNKAKKQTENIIKGLFEGAIGKRTLHIIYS